MYYQDAVIYTADDQNIHSVDEITDGERLTLTLWFTRDNSHDEDAKLISLLSQRSLKCQDGSPDLFLPYPASSNMYWFSHQQSGFDIRCARTHILGFSFHSSDYKVNNTSSDTLDDPLEQLVKPIRIGRGDKIFDKEFVSSLHALQILQFYYWKASELQALGRETIVADRSAQQPLADKTSYSELVIPGDLQLAETILGHSCHDDDLPSFDWIDLTFAVATWEEYVRAMQESLMTSIPYWSSHGIIFSNCSTDP